MSAKRISFSTMVYPANRNGAPRPLREDFMGAPSFTTRTRYGPNGPYPNVPKQNLWTTREELQKARIANFHNYGPNYQSYRGEKIAKGRRATLNRLRAEASYFSPSKPKRNSHSLRAAAGKPMGNRDPSNYLRPRNTAFTRRQNRGHRFTHRRGITRSSATGEVPMNLY